MLSEPQKAVLQEIVKASRASNKTARAGITVRLTGSDAEAKAALANELARGLDGHRGIAILSTSLHEEIEPADRLRFHHVAHFKPRK